MNTQDILRRILSMVIYVCMLPGAAYTQTGNLTVTFTPKNGSAVTLKLSQPLLKFDNAHGYWFVNPHNGDRHMQYMPDAGYGDRAADIAFITFNESVNDFDIYETPGNDSNQLTIQNKFVGVTAPEDGKPMHIHINSFTASEINFTVSGMARSRVIKESSNNWTSGTIEGTGHFYREPKYIQSDVLAGCDCDPAIYAMVYDEENNVRTTSVCENAIRNKIFDAVQKAMAPLFTNIAYKGSPPMSTGDIDISMMAGHIDINVPVKDRPYCSGDYRHNWHTGIDAHKKVVQSLDAYGLRFIKAPESNEKLFGGQDVQQARNTRLASFMDSINKLMIAKKMNSDQFNKALKDFGDDINTGAPDLKKMEVEDNLYLTVSVNPTSMDESNLRLTDKSKTLVQHNVKGAVYEIFCPQKKDDDGNWTGNKEAVYLGKFLPPVITKSGYDDIANTKAVYPPNANKLSVFDIIIKMEGGRDMIDKALANIDFNALLELITKQ
jgi:hypothetical protein